MTNLAKGTTIVVLHLALPSYVYESSLEKVLNECTLSEESLIDCDKQMRIFRARHCQLLQRVRDMARGQLQGPLGGSSVPTVPSWINGDHTANRAREFTPADSLTGQTRVD